MTNRRRRCGKSQHGALAAELLQTLFRSTSAVGKLRGPEWRCGKCDAFNFAERTACRLCGKPKSGASGATPRPAPRAPKASLAAPKPAAADVKDKRAPAPEVRAAEAGAQASALESSAKVLRATGLAEQAESLEKEALQLRKRASLPLPGMRLDQCAAFVERCKKRLANSEAAVSAAVANCEEASKELKEAEAQLGRLTAELGQAEAASSPAMEQNVAEAAPKRCRQGDSVEAQSAEPDRSAAAPVAEPTVPVADVQVLIAQAVEAAMATAMQVQIQKVMDHFEGQVIALQSSLTEGFEARLAEAVAGIQLSAAMARRTARAEPYKAPG